MFFFCPGLLVAALLRSLVVGHFDFLIERQLAKSVMSTLRDVLLLRCALVLLLLVGPFPADCVPHRRQGDSNSGTLSLSFSLF